MTRRVRTFLSMTVLTLLATSAVPQAQNGSSFVDAASSAIDYTTTPWRMVLPCRALHALTNAAFSVVSADAMAARGRPRDSL